MIYICAQFDYIYQYFVCYSAIELGCRVGEALALRISDFDLKNQGLEQFRFSSFLVI
jgi:integrase